MEPLLSQEHNRMTVYPIKFPSIWDAYKKQMAAFWTAETVDLSKDLEDWEKLNENEKKVGYALVEILENWETAFQSMDGGSKYNKNSVLETMSNYTNLSNKDIRLAMKRYKELYELLKNNGL
jgi:ribonucleotide reductase beta subunit family protein with ferritin-like domain